MLVKVEGGKTNFIDSNDNFVGYEDQYTSCCENPFWEFIDSSGESMGINVNPNISANFTGDVVHGDMTATFPLDIGWSLRLTNNQNGFYSHFWDHDFNGDYKSGSI